jgi:hypothetical protein
MIEDNIYWLTYGDVRNVGAVDCKIIFSDPAVESRKGESSTYSQKQQEHLLLCNMSQMFLAVDSERRHSQSRQHHQ